jgi:hypothetical protein
VFSKDVHFKTTLHSGMKSAGYVAHVGEKRNAFMGCVKT